MDLREGAAIEPRSGPSSGHSFVNVTAGAAGGTVTGTQSPRDRTCHT
jgi:hypothetical protein